MKVFEKKNNEFTGDNLQNQSLYYKMFLADLHRHAQRKESVGL